MAKDEKETAPRDAGEPAKEVPVAADASAAEAAGAEGEASSDAEKPSHDEGEPSDAASGSEKASEKGEATSEAKATDSDPGAKKADKDAGASSKKAGGKKKKSSGEAAKKGDKKAEKDEHAPLLAREHGAPEVHAPHGHKPNRRQYFIIFGVLFGLTVLEVGLAQMPGISVTLMAIGLIGMALTKAACVGLFYMHLKDEAKILRLSVMIPFAAPAIYALVLISDAAWRLAR